MDMNTFERILSGFQSANAEERKSAEKTFEDMKNNDPNNTIFLVLQSLKSSADSSIRLQSAIMIRNFFRGVILNKDNLWQKIDEQTRNTVKMTLLNCLDEEREDRLIRNNICDTISDLATELIPNDQWKDLGSKVFEMISTQNPCHQQSGLKILGEIAPIIIRDLKNNMNILCKIVEESLQSPSLDVRSECIGLIASIVEDGDKDILKKLSEYLNLIIESISLMYEYGERRGDFQTAIKTLESLIRIAESEGGSGVVFLKPQLPQFCNQLASLADLNSNDNQQLEYIKKSAVEILLCIVEKKPKLALKVPDYISRVVQILMKFMLDIQEEKYVAWLDYGTEDEDTEQKFFDVGEAGLDRIARAFQEEENSGVMNIIFHLASEFLKRDEWQYKFVAIMAISQTVEFIPKEEEEQQIHSITNVLLKHLEDPDRRVRFAACQGIGQLALDHQPYVQEKFHAEVLPALIRTMDDSHHRVQSHALAAFINYAEEVEKNALLPYTDVLMEKLLSRLTNNSPKLLREHVVTAIAVIAGVVEEYFMKYYSTVMPIMMKIMNECTDKDNRSSRGKAIECISIIGLSIGQKQFLPDGKLAMQALLQILDQNLENDDPVKEYAQDALGRLCRSMKEYFVEYLPHIVPKLLATLSQLPKEYEGEDKSQDDDDDDDMTYVMLESGKSMGLKTSLIEEQENALDLLNIFIEVLQDKYINFIEPTATALIPTLTHILSDDVKQKALETMAGLIEAFKIILDKTQGDRTMLQEMLISTAQAVFKNLEDQDIDLDIMVAEAGGLNECIQKAGPNLLSQDKVASFAQRVFWALENSSERRLCNISRKEEEDIDEDDVNEIEEEDMQEHALRSSLLDILGALMTYYPKEYIESSSEVTINFIDKNIHSNLDDERAIALYVCDDILEHLKESGVPLWNVFIEKLLQSITSKDASVSQAASYGVAQGAKLEAFAQYAETSAQQLVENIRRSNALKNRQETASTDNSIAALGDLVRYQEKYLSNPKSYLNLWLNYLPLKQDETEGVRVHKNLVELVEQNNQNIIGANNENVPKLVSIFTTIYKTDFSDASIDNSIRNLMQQLGEERLNHIGETLTHKQKRKLQKIIADAIQENIDGQNQNSLYQNR